MKRVVIFTPTLLSTKPTSSPCFQFNVYATYRSTIIMVSLNGSRSNSPSPPPDFDLESTFPEISILIAHAEQYASGLNLIVRNHPKSLFTAKSWPFSEPFPEVKVPLRGHILCSPKSNGRVVGSKCNWKLVYKLGLGLSAGWSASWSAG